MSNYTASALLAAQAKFIPSFETPEVRRKQDPALMLALKNMEVTIPTHQELRKKDDRAVKAYIKTKRAASATTTKAHNHTGTKADSKEVTLSWVKFVEPFTIYLKQGQSNIFGYAEQLAHEMMESARNLHSRAGTAALAYLQSNRSQLASLTTGGSGSWNNTNFALEVAGADKDRFLQNAASFMRVQNFRGQYDAILDAEQYRKMQYILQQGAANQANLSWQAADFATIAETTEAIDANYSNGSALIMPANSFAGLPWNDPTNRQGKGDYDSVLGGYGVVTDPLGSGLNFDFHAYTTRADGSSQGGGVQDEVLEAEMTLTIGWVLPPLSTADEAVVYELAQLT
ncbi:MAG: hypothetical protein KA954_01245 [Chitinophagales bacterium]|nr:hypothetical protein [Chitinophagales bacterium]